MMGLTSAAEVFWGVLVPSLVFVIAFIVTVLLYRHFARKG